MTPDNTSATHAAVAAPPFTIARPRFLIFKSVAVLPTVMSWISPFKRARFLRPIEACQDGPSLRGLHVLIAEFRDRHRGAALCPSSLPAEGSPPSTISPIAGWLPFELDPTPW